MESSCVIASYDVFPVQRATYCVWSIAAVCCDVCKFVTLLVCDFINITGKRVKLSSWNFQNRSLEGHWLWNRATKFARWQRLQCGANWKDSSALGKHYIHIFGRQVFKYIHAKSARCCWWQWNWEFKKRKCRFLPVFYCNYMTTFYCFWDTIYWLKIYGFRRFTDPSLALVNPWEPWYESWFQKN